MERAKAASLVQLQTKVILWTRVGSKSEIVRFRNINETLDTNDFKHDLFILKCYAFENSLARVNRSLLCSESRKSEEDSNVEAMTRFDLFIIVS